MSKSLVRILILLFISYASCKDDDFLEGYNRDELFAEPKQAELDAVLADWKSRDLSVKNYKVEQETKIGAANAVLKIVSFSVNGYKEYGALLIPDGDGLPVRMYVGGFGIGNTINSIKLAGSNSNDIPSIFAFPALRGQSLSMTINDVEYTSPVSEGEHCNAFDGATDDVLAFLNVIERTEARADVNRTSVRGGSRGATVALLAGERDNRVKLAIGVAGPVDLMGLTSSSENDPTYQCQFLSDLVNGGETIQSARLKMISSSPLFFAELLPKTQLHLGKDDRIVPVSQGEAMKKILTDQGKADSFELFIYEGRNHENITTDNNELIDRINAFLKQL